MWHDFPSEKYDVVLADPPWSYYGQQNKWGAAAKFYDTITDDNMLAMPMPNILHKHSILFLWATGPRLDFALKCISHWGLTYRGMAFVWVKTKLDGKTPIGAQGVRPSVVKPTCEFVIAASMTPTGRPMKLADESVANVVLAPRGEHSAKPDEVHSRIERLYPDASRIELFARTPHTGWNGWGDEYEH